MKKVIDWIKANLPIVISVTVAVVSIALLVLGIMDTSAAEQMSTDARVINQLKGISPPLNEKVIDKAVADQKQKRNQLRNILAELNRNRTLEPIQVNVFPEIPPEKLSVAPYEFRDRFREKHRELLKRLNAQDRPSKDYRVESEDTGPSRRPPGPAGRQTTEKTTDHEERLNLIRANNIYCYAGIDSLNPHKEITETTSRPTIIEMWYAQVGIWIQQEIIDALARVNEEAIEQLPQDTKPWVGILPIKHLKEITIKGLDATGATARQAGPGAAAKDAFVDHSSGKVDTFSFTIELVTESDALLRTIDSILEQGFYTLLEPTLKAISVEDVPAGYIYGTRPVVLVELTFEVCFLFEGDYKELMPEEVKELRGGASGKGRPVRY